MNFYENHLKSTSIFFAYFFAGKLLETTLYFYFSSRLKMFDVDTHFAAGRLRV